MTVDEELGLMWRCVYAHYILGWKVNKISQHERILRAKVSELLQRAVAIGMLQIVGRPPRETGLETAIIDKYGLKDAMVVLAPGLVASGEAGDDDRDDNFKTRLSALAAAPAQYVQAAIKRVAMQRSEQGKPVRIGLACGRTLYAVTARFDDRFLADPELRGANLELYPLNVAYGPQLGYQLPNVLVSNVYMKWTPADENVEQLKAYNLTIPIEAIETTDEEVDREQRLRARLEPYGMWAAFEAARAADIFLLGIGSPKAINPGYRGVFEGLGGSFEGIEDIADGEINYQLFNRRGFLDDLAPSDDTHGVNLVAVAKANKKITAVSLRDLRRASMNPDKYVIAVAFGQEKAEAVDASLGRNLLCYNVLITDETIASKLVTEQELAAHLQLRPTPAPSSAQPASHRLGRNSLAPASAKNGGPAR